VGYYRETAVLSALVYKDFGIGAWTNHIVVTKEEAAVAAQELFGLPAVIGTVAFAETETTKATTTNATTNNNNGNGDGELWLRALASSLKFLRTLAEELAVQLKFAFGTAVPGISDPSERLRRPKVVNSNENEKENSKNNSPRRFVFENVNFVRVEGWDGWTESDTGNDKDNENDNDREGQVAFRFALSLPSFSGKLHLDDDLLRYDLTLGPAQTIRLRPPIATSVLFGQTDDVDDDDGTNDDGASASSSNQNRNQSLLAGVLGGPVGAIPCIQVDGVTVVAGKPETIGESWTGGFLKL
jgi:hypothetical protein